MKKLIVALAAAMLMIFSVVPTFTASAATATQPTTSSQDVVSPVATNPTGPVTRERFAPKTGIDNTMIYVIIGLSALACGTSAVALVKTSKTSKK